MALPTSKIDKSVKQHAETTSSSQSQPFKRLSSDCASSEAFGNNKTSMTGHTSSKEKSFVTHSAPHVDILTRLAQARADLDKRYGKLSSQAQSSVATAGKKWTEVKPGAAPTESKSKTRLSRSARQDDSKQGASTPDTAARKVPEEYVFFTTTGGGPPRRTLPQRPKVLVPASKQLHAGVLRDASLSTAVSSVTGRPSISTAVDNVPKLLLAKLDSRSVLVPTLPQSITHSSSESQNDHIEKDYQVASRSGLHPQCMLVGTVEGAAALRGGSEAHQPRAARTSPLQNRPKRARSRRLRSLSCPPRLVYVVHKVLRSLEDADGESQTSPALSVSDHGTHFNDTHLPAPLFGDTGYAPDDRNHGIVSDRPTHEALSRSRSAPPSSSPTISTQLAHLAVRSAVLQNASNTSLLTFKTPFIHETHYCEQRIMAHEQHTQSDSGSGLFDTTLNTGFADNFDDLFNDHWDAPTDDNYATFSGTGNGFHDTLTQSSGHSGHNDGISNDSTGIVAGFNGNSTHFNHSFMQSNSDNTQLDDLPAQNNGSTVQLDHNVAQTNATAVRHDNTPNHNHTFSDVFTDDWVLRYAARWRRMNESSFQAHGNDAPSHEPKNTSNDIETTNSTSDDGIGHDLNSLNHASTNYDVNHNVDLGNAANIGFNNDLANSIIGNANAIHPTPDLVQGLETQSALQPLSLSTINSIELSSRASALPAFPPRNKIGAPVASTSRQAPQFNNTLHPAQTPKLVNTFTPGSSPQGTSQYAYTAQPMQAPSPQPAKIVNPPHVFRQHKFPAQYFQTQGTKRTHNESGGDDVQITKHIKLVPEAMSRSLSSESRPSTAANDASSGENPQAPVFSNPTSPLNSTPVTSPEQFESSRVPARLAAPPFSLSIETDTDSEIRGYRCTNDEIMPYITSWVRKEKELGVLKPTSMIKISCNPGYGIGNRGEKRRFWQIEGIVKDLIAKAEARSKKSSLSEEEVMKLSAEKKAEIEETYKRLKRKQYREAAMARMTPEEKAAKLAKAKADREAKAAARKAEKEREAGEAEEGEEDDSDGELEFEEVATRDVPPQPDVDEDADLAAQMQAALDVDEDNEEKEKEKENEGNENEENEDNEESEYEG